MTFVLHNGYRFRIDTKREGKRIQGTYHFKSVEDLQSIAWWDTDSKDRISPRRDHLEQVFKEHHPGFGYDFTVVSDTEMRGMFTGLGYRWSGSSVTEYRADRSRVVATLVDIPTR